MIHHLLKSYAERDVMQFVVPGETIPEAGNPKIHIHISPFKNRYI